MSEETYAGAAPGENEATRIARIEDLLPRAQPLGPREAFIAAYDRMSSLAGITRGPSVIAAAVNARARVIEAVVIESGQALVVGRHTRCGLRLRSDSVSLRHLVVHVRAEAAGAPPVTRLWDLNTGQPFTTEDGQPNVAVRAEGPLYAAIGEYALLFVPTRGMGGAAWPARPEDAWQALPPRKFVDRRAPDSLPWEEPAHHARADGQSRVTRFRPLTMLGDGEAEETPWGELRVETDSGVWKHPVSTARLDQGVLVGRYHRCGISLGELDSLSRVHLLVVRIGGEVWAIDTASTNGTFRTSSQVETTTLGDPDSLLLGRVVQVHWRRLPPGP